MQPFYFCNTSRVFFGEGAVTAHLARLVGERGTGRVLLAWGRGGAAACGALDDVRRELARCGARVIEFSGIMPNPTYGKVLEGARLVRGEQVGLIVAVGGGSVMDCCKAISLVAASGLEGDAAWGAYWEREGEIAFSPVPVGVVATASGTGSEVNGEGVITHEGRGRKLGRDYPACTPVFSILDPAYTCTLDALQTAAGGFDSFTHVAETYLSAPDDENVSDDLAEALMRGIVRDLPRALAAPGDVDARGNLMWESTVAELRLIKAGKELDFGPHMLEHQLGALTDCVHGCGLAAIYPAYYRYVIKGASSLVKFCRLAERVWGIERAERTGSEQGIERAGRPDSERGIERALKTDREPGIDRAVKTDRELALAGIDAIAGFIRSCGLPGSLTELGVSTDEAFLRRVADAVGGHGRGYRKLDADDLYRILLDARF